MSTAAGQAVGPVSSGIKPDPPGRGVGKAPLWTKDFVVGTLTNFVLSCNYFMLTVVMTAYAMDVYHAPAALAAFCASIFIVGTLIARLISPALMVKLQRKRLLFIGTVFGCAASCLYLVDTSFALLMGIRFIHGVAYGVCSTTIATIVTALVPASRKGEGIGYYMLSVTLGAAIGPFAGILISRHVSYDVLFICAAIVLVVALLCILALHADTKVQTPSEAEEEIIGEELAGSLEGKREEEAARRVSRQPWGSRLDRVVERSAIPISVVSFLIFFGYSSLLTFLTPFAESVGLTRAASVFFIVYALSMLATRPFTGRAFDRRGPLLVMTPAFVSFSAGMVMLAFASNDWMILGSGLLCGYGVGTVQSCGLAMAVKKASDERLSIANATFYMFLDMGVGVGPLLLGLAVPVIGYSWMYVAMAGVGLLALVVFLIVRKRY